MITMVPPSHVFFVISKYFHAEQSDNDPSGRDRKITFFASFFLIRYLLLKISKHLGRLLGLGFIVHFFVTLGRSIGRTGENWRRGSVRETDRERERGHTRRGQFRKYEQAGTDPLQ